MIVMSSLFPVCYQNWLPCLKQEHQICLKSSTTVCFKSRHLFRGGVIIKKRENFGPFP